MHTDWHNGAKPFAVSSTVESLRISGDSPSNSARKSTAKRRLRNITNYELTSVPCTPPPEQNRINASIQDARSHSPPTNIFGIIPKCTMVRSKLIFAVWLTYKSEKRYTCANSTCLPVNGEPIKFYPTWTALQHHNRTAHPPSCMQPSCNGRIFASQKGLRAHQKLHEQQAAEAEIDAAITSGGEDVDGERPRKRRRGGDVGRDWKCDVDGCTKDFKSARLRCNSPPRMQTNRLLFRKRH